MDTGRASEAPPHSRYPSKTPLTVVSVFSITQSQLQSPICIVTVRLLWTCAKQFQDINVKMFTFDTQSDAITGQFPLKQIFPNTTNIRILFINSEQEEDDSDMDTEMREFYSAAMRGATSERFLPENHHNNRVRRQYGGYDCSNSLGIFNFLLFLVVLAGLLATLLNNAMVNIMLNGENVSLFQVIWRQKSSYISE